MKRVIFPALISLVVFAQCSNGPTQAERAEALKRSYVSLVNSLMSEVAAFRGKPFKQDLAIAVYTRSEYAAMVGSSSQSMSASTKNKYNAIFTREHLLRPGQDYFASSESATSSSVGGFYVDGTDSIFIITEDNATRISADDSIAIFHELVHALQDQYYSLQRVDDNAGSWSDRQWALRYVVEGEAELLCTYYAYKMYYGFYPSSPSPIMDQFDYWQTTGDIYLDSLHFLNYPLYSIQPMFWAYYSKGPVFINAIAGNDWAKIDNAIFSSPPLRTMEVLHPADFSQSNEYLLDLNKFTDDLENTHTILDVDEFGELLTNVMFREWDFENYNQIAQGMNVDRIITYRGTQDDTLRLAWYTSWSSAAACTTFASSYAQLVNKSEKITLPSGVHNGTLWTVSDTGSRTYIERNDSSNSVIILENYPRPYFSAWLTDLRAAAPYLRSGTAKRAVSEKKYPHVNKDKGAGGIPPKPWR